MPKAYNGSNLGAKLVDQAWQRQTKPNPSFGPLPETLEAKTGKGRHLYFKKTTDTKIPSTNGVIAKKIDVKADGGRNDYLKRKVASLLGQRRSAQCRCEQSVTRSPLMAYWSYCFVVVWFVNQFRMGKDLFLIAAPWHIKKTITFSDMLAAARRSHFTTGISCDPGVHRSYSKIDRRRFSQLNYSLKKANL